MHRSTDVALPVGRDVEMAGVGEVFVGLGRDDGADPAAAQRVADRARGVGLVREHGVGPGSWSASPGRARHTNASHDRVEGDRVVPVPAGGRSGDRPAAGVGGEVDLRAQPTAGTAQRLPGRALRRVSAAQIGGILVIRHGPRDRPVPPGGRPPRADAPAPPWNPPPPSTPHPRPGRSRAATPSRRAPTSRPPTSVGAGYRPSSNSRNTTADPATDNPFGSATTRR
jgi:hypothetical protein